MSNNKIPKRLLKLTQEYSYPVSQIDLGGRSIKKFVRLDKCLFGGLVNSIKSGNSSYVTYLNDIIKDGYMLQYVSTMQKSINSYTYYYDKNAYSDVAGSRVANMLGVKTCYNCLYSKKSKKGILKPTHLLSVDFLKNDEKMWTLSDLNGYGSVYTTPWHWIECIDNVVNDSKSLFKGIDIKKHLPKLHDDFIEQFLLHNYVLADADYCSRNIGIIVDEKRGTMELAPSHDYDLCLNSDTAIDITWGLQLSMHGLSDMYPEQLRNFMAKIDRYDAEKLRSQLMKEIPDKNFVDNYISLLSQNIDKIKKSYKHYTINEIIK